MYTNDFKIPIGQILAASWLYDIGIRLKIFFRVMLVNQLICSNLLVLGEH